MVRFLSVLFLLVVQFATAADITISGPTKIEPRRMVRLTIEGLTDQELSSSEAKVTPPAGVDSSSFDVFPGKTWQNKPYIDFWASTPGKYAIEIDVNLFRRKLDEGVTAATASNVDPELLSELKIVVTKIGDKYEAKSGSVLLEVAGTVPPPPDPDNPPVTSGLVWTVVIRTVDTMTADQSQVLSDLRQWSDQQPFDKVAHWEFPPNAVGPDGSPDRRVATWVAKMPATAKEPYVFVAAKDAAGKSAIIWQGELTKSAEEIINKIKGHASK